MESLSQFDVFSPHEITLIVFVFIFISFALSAENHQASRAGWLFLDQWQAEIYVCEECAVTLLISELMAYEFEGGDWLIRQMAISQQLMHIDMVKGSVNVWLTASFVCCIYVLVCLSSELLMCCNLWTCRSWQIALSEQSRDFTFAHCTIVSHLVVDFAVWTERLIAE